jgi:hypothetical protein
MEIARTEGIDEVRRDIFGRRDASYLREAEAQGPHVAERAAIGLRRRKAYRESDDKINELQGQLDATEQDRLFGFGPVLDTHNILQDPAARSLVKMRIKNEDEKKTAADEAYAAEMRHLDQAVRFHNESLALDTTFGRAAAGGARGRDFELVKLRLGNQLTERQMRERNDPTLTATAEAHRAQEAAMETQIKFHEQGERIGVAGSTAASILRGSNMPFEAAMTAAAAAGALATHNAAPDEQSAVAAQGLARMAEIRALFERTVNQTNLANRDAGRIARLLGAGDERSAGLFAIRARRAETLAALPSGEQGERERPEILKRFAAEESQFTTLFDYQRNLLQQSMQGREAVTGLQASGAEKSARASGIFFSALDEASKFRGPDAGPFRRLALQTGINEELAYKRRLEYEQSAGSVRNDVAPGFLGAGMTTNRPNEQDYGPAIKDATQAIKDLHEMMRDYHAILTTP